MKEIDLKDKFTLKETAKFLSVSITTVNNWEKHCYIKRYGDSAFFLKQDVLKLKSDIESGKIDRLKKRANKIKSNITFLPKEYVKDKKFINELNQIKFEYTEKKLDLEVLLFYLSLKLFLINGEVKFINDNFFIEFDISTEWKRECVKNEFLHWYSELESGFNAEDYKASFEIFESANHDDTLGIIYQSLLLEGNKSEKGSYYTPGKIVDSMLKDNIEKSSSFLDPCCGTGQFILGATRNGFNDMQNLYGCDIDKLAVHIARLNLLNYVKNKEFRPQIFHINFLSKNDVFKNKLFDFIATNPPWGAITRENKEAYQDILSGESFSYFIHRAVELLKPNGLISFVLPESILYTKIHADIRSFLLNNSSILSIRSLGRQFKKVFTNVIILNATKNITRNDSIEVFNKKMRYIINQSRFKNNTDYIFDIKTSDDEYNLIEKIYSIDHFYLTNKADWALGIVTGNNEKYISKEKLPGFEEIYKGKDVNKFFLGETESFIKFDPQLYQQIANTKFFRADEKLIYKFISNKLVFAFDDKQSLTLNSANILIPHVKGYDIKVICAFLNSSVFQFVFRTKFNAIKVLKSHINGLPFPLISDELKKNIIKLVNQAIVNKDENIQFQIDKIIYKIFNLDNSDVEIIENY